MSTRLPAALALACAAFAQPPAFEVASVKLSEPITPAMVQSGRLQIGVTIDSRNVRISKFSLFDLTVLAYQVKAHQVSGPAWMTTERYDIQAKLPEGATRGQVPAMLQTLLADRFGMRIHRESREFKVLALTVAKSGPHLKESSGEDMPAAEGGQLRGGTTVGAGGTMTFTAPGGDSRVTPGPGGNLHIETSKMTLSRLANFINRYCEYPVVDMTDLKGAYDMEFDVSGEELRSAARAHGAVIPTPADAASDPAGVSLTSSLAKLGLKLESRRAPAEVIVVDKVEKIPTEN